MRFLAAAALLYCLWLGPPGAARADTIIVGGGWQAFSWTNAPGAFNAEGPLTFTSAQASKLTVTDAFLDGDRFQVFDNNVSLGLTSVATDDGTQVGANADAALTNPKFSSGVFQLQAGSHSVTLQTTSIAAGHPDGTAFLRVDANAAPQGTPEPGSMALLAAAGACLAVYRWRLTRRRPTGHALVARS